MPLEPYAYALAGRGRWARILREVLSTEGRPTHQLEQLRRGVSESDAQYQQRMSAVFSASGAHIAWICIPPCAEVPLLIESAILAGLHVIVEKPWLYPTAEAERLAQLAQSRRLLAGIHFQYCFLRAVGALRLRHSHIPSNLRFRGIFTLSRPNRLALTALDNLGSHLLAIREYAVPDSEIAQIECAYNALDERRVEIQDGAHTIESIDLAGAEPLIPLFLAGFEAAIPQLNFPLDLLFAARVHQAVNSVRASH